MISEELLKKLADKIKTYLKKDFEEIHLSENLMNTIEVSKTESGFLIEIPAQVYDIARFKNEKVIIYTGSDSYANEVDNSGGFSKKHKDYIENAVLKSIEEWIKENDLIVRVKEV